MTTKMKGGESDMNSSPVLSRTLSELDQLISWKKKRLHENPVELARSLDILEDRIREAFITLNDTGLIEFFKKLEKLDIPFEEVKFWLSPLGIIDLDLYQNALDTLDLIVVYKEIAGLVLEVHNREEPLFEEVVSLISQCEDEVQLAVVLAISGSIVTWELVSILTYRIYRPEQIRKARQLLNNFEVLNLHFRDEKNDSPSFPHNGDDFVHTAIKVIRSVRNAHPEKKRAIFMGLVPLLGVNGISRMFEIDKKSLKELVSMLPSRYYISEAVIEYGKYLFGQSDPDDVLNPLVMSFRSWIILRIEEDPGSVSRLLLDVRNDPVAVRGLAYLMCAERIVKRLDRVSLEKALADVVHAISLIANLIPGVFPEIETFSKEEKKWKC
jgi:hypothetical protein